MKKNKKENFENQQFTDSDFTNKKAKKTRIAISCFALLLAVGVVGNWYWENSDISSKVSTISSAKDKILDRKSVV